MEAKKLWSAVSARLSERLPADVYERWIGAIEVVSVRDGEMELAVPNGFYVEWLEENYAPLIRSAAAEVLGGDATVRFTVRSEDRSQPDLFAFVPPVPAAAAEEARPRKPARFVSPLNPKLSFGTFVVGPSNSFAHAAAMAVAQSPAKAYNPLLIHGGTGLGKTHLMQAIGHHVAQSSKTAQVCYTTCESFLNEYITALQEKSFSAFRKKYRSMDVLLIDDVHFLAGKSAIQEEFFHTFNALHIAHKQIVLTCDRPMNEVQGLEPRLVSRFEWGLTVELEPPDLETRIAILRNKAESLGLPIPDEAIHYIAEHVRANIRRMEGALTSVSLYQSVTPRPLTLDTLETLLRDTIDRESAQAPTLESIQKAVADQFDLRLSDMTSKRRPQAVAFPRQVAMFLCRSLTAHSLPAIGDAFGRNHATVIHACRTVTTRMSQDAHLRQMVTKIRQKLGAD